MKNIFLFAFLFSIHLFSQTDSTARKNYASYVILPCNKINLIKYPVQAKELWLPDSATVENIFSKMQQGLDSLQMKIPRNPHDLYDTAAKRNLLRPLKNYYFQTLGVVTKDNHKMIYFNACCEMNGANWTQRLFFVLDGGNCFFQVMYDLTEKKWKYLQINGEA